MIGMLFRSQLRNVLRSRWVYVHAGFFAVLGETLYQAGGSAAGMQVAMMNIVLIVLPLIAIVYGAIYVHGAREFYEVLAAQPVRRRDIFVSSYIVVGGALAGCYILGAGIPLAVHAETCADVASAAMLVAAGALLTLVFTAVAFAVAIGIHDRARAIGAALMLWFYFSLLYDGIVLYLFYALSDYPAEPFALAFTFLNPVDLARIALTMQFDVSALMGYTGAVFEQLFGTGLGLAAAFAALLLWAGVPFLIAQRLFTRRDF
ncbi:MAG: ABC transporter permease subunit [Ignavibacteria bacterium]|nr:ABC transporter permease subunit [Ignavibacteria bacterium]